MPSVLRAIRACPQPLVALPGTQLPVRKPPSLRISSDSRSRSSRTSRASMRTPNRASSRRSAGTRRGRVPSIAAGCGWSSRKELTPAPTSRVAHTPARFNVSYCSRSGNLKGPTGGSLLAKTTFIQRLNTAGGAVPTSACTAGQTQLVPYTADYFFYRADKQ